MAMLATSLGDDLEELFPDEPVPERPNKFTGLANTWQSWTSNERELARSVEIEDDLNLSLQLYCTHKVRVEIERQEAIDEAAINAALPPKELKLKMRMRRKIAGPPRKAVWRPMPQWTSWPMETKDVPLPDLVDVSLRRLPRDTNLDKAKLVTRDLKEEICATVMRKARAMKEKTRSKGPPTDNGQTGNAHAQGATTISPSDDVPPTTPENSLPILEDDLCLERLNEPISDVISQINIILDAWIQDRKRISPSRSRRWTLWKDLLRHLEKTHLEPNFVAKIDSRCNALLDDSPG